MYRALVAGYSDDSWSRCDGYGACSAHSEEVEGEEEVCLSWLLVVVVAAAEVGVSRWCCGWG